MICPCCGKPKKPKTIDGLGTALKPAVEFVALMRKPLGEATVAAQVLATGTGALNIDATRVAHGETLTGGTGTVGKHPGWDRPWMHDGSNRESFKSTAGRWPANVVHSGEPEVLAAFAAYGESKSSDRLRNNAGSIGYGGSEVEFVTRGHADTGTAARFFFSAKAGADDRIVRDVEEVEVEWTSDCGPCRVLLQADMGQSPLKAIAVSPSAAASEWSTFLSGSGITDLCRQASICTTRTGTSWTTASTTWSWLTRSLINASTGDANSATANGTSHAASAAPNILSASITLKTAVSLPGASLVSSGTQLRINVSAKRHSHPTCKPVALMRWLVRLVCPPGGLVCDPFAGSGTTGMACLREGMRAVLIEREAEHVADIRHRLAHIGGEDTPLFAAPADDEQPGLFSEVA